MADRVVVVPEPDPTCGSGLLNLFGVKSLSSPSQYSVTNLQFLQGADDYCDPTIEQCSTAEQLSTFEDYEEYNRFLG